MKRLDASARYLAAFVAVYLGPLILLAIAATITVENSRQSLIEQATPVIVPVVSQETTARYPVGVELSLVSPPPIRSNAPNGIVTDIFVKRGDEVQPNQVVWEIDARQVVAISSPIPLWRDIAIGDEGPDVAAIGGFLLGSATGSESAVAGDDMLQAASEFARSMGHSLSLEVIPKEWFVWLPSQGFVVEDVQIEVGGSIGQGEVALFGRPVAAELSIGVIGAELPVSSALQLVTGQLVIPVADIASTVTLLDLSPRDISELEAALASGAWIQETPARSVPAVPATSILASAAGGLCLVTPNQSGEMTGVSVDVIGSRGQTSLLEEAEFSEVVANPLDSGLGHLCGAD